MKKSDGFRMKALYAVSSILLGLIQRAVGIGNNLLQGDREVKEIMLQMKYIQSSLN